MKRLIISILLFAAFGISAFAQNKESDQVIMTIDGEKVYLSEFEKVYLKTNKNRKEKKSIDEYLDLFINYKLKVKEAKEIGMDTAKAFLHELDGYRRQLAAPYLANEEVIEKLVEEAYARLQYDIRASHILSKVGPEAVPEDTLKAYKKIMKAKKRILAGESFEKVALEVSDDPSAKAMPGRPEGNKGDLGYFTALNMVYPFETLVYETPVGEVAGPVRTDYGYHIVKVNDKQDALGMAKIAHIMTAAMHDSLKEDAKDRIYLAYEELENGASFGEVAKKYSADKRSADQNGELPWFSVNRMIPQYIEKIYHLDSGEYTKPFQTIFGWHIIMFIDRKPIPPFEEKREELLKQVKRDQRSNIAEENVIENLKKDYKFKLNKEAKAEFVDVLNDSIYLGKWNINKAKALDDILFTMGDTTIYQQDFAKYIFTHQNRIKNPTMQAVVDFLYGKFEKEVIKHYQDVNLEKNYPEFGKLMQEYKNGILLFNLTDKKVWSKAVEDSAGLVKFYEESGKKYMWPERLDASIFKAKSEKSYKKAKKLAMKMDKKNISQEEILSKTNTGEDSLSLHIVRHKYVEGQNPLIDKVPWKKGIYDVASDKENDVRTFIVVHQKLEPMEKTIAEAKGLITADYQNYLEKEWTQNLRKKYSVNIHEEVVEKLKEQW